MVYTCPNRQSFTRARATPCACAVPSPKRACLITAFPVLRSRRAPSKLKATRCADKEPLCASVCASRSSLSTSSMRPSCALCLIVQHLFGPSCSSAHLSTLIEQLPTSSLKRLLLNKVEERALKVLKRRFSTTSLQPDS